MVGAHASGLPGRRDDRTPPLWPPLPGLPLPPAISVLWPTPLAGSIRERIERLATGTVENLGTIVVDAFCIKFTKKFKELQDELKQIWLQAELAQLAGDCMAMSAPGSPFAPFLQGIYQACDLLGGCPCHNGNSLGVACEPECVIQKSIELLDFYSKTDSVDTVGTAFPLGGPVNECIDHQLTAMGFTNSIVKSVALQAFLDTALGKSPGTGLCPYATILKDAYSAVDPFRVTPAAQVRSALGLVDYFTSVLDATNTDNVSTVSSYNDMRLLMALMILRGCEIDPNDGPNVPPQRKPYRRSPQDTDSSR